MARSYTVSFNITGAMDGSLLSAIQSAQNALKGLNRTARAASNASKLTGLAGMGQSLNAIQQAANKFRELKKASIETQQALANAQKQVGQLARQSKADTKAVDDLRKKFADLSKAQAMAQKERTADKANATALKNQLKELKAAYAEAKKLGDTAKMAGLTSAINSTGAALQAQQAKIKATAQAFKELSDKIKQTKSDLRSAETTAASSSKGFDSAKSQAASLKASLQTQLESLQRLRSQLGAAGFNTSHFAASERQLQSEIERVNQSLQRQQQLLQARQNFNAAAGNLGLASAGMMGALYTAQQVAQPFETAIDKAIQFEHTMSTLKSISQMDLIKAGDTAQVERNMARLTAQAKELGATTIYTAQQVGEAQVYIARTGWNTDAIEKSMPSILRLAAANRMDIESTADIVTNVMTAFGHGVDQIDRDTDVFAYTVTHSNQTLTQFGEAMKYAAPVAKLFGATIEEAAMMTKFMGDAGIQGSMAGTSMRQTMLRLTAPPKKASKAMDELGVSTSDATKAWNEAQEVAASYGVTLDSTLGAGRQFISIMEQIDRGFIGKSDREKLAAVSAITGINAVSGAANVFGAGAAQAKNFTELLENCRGALEQTYSTMTDDTFGAQKSFESAWEAVQLSFGEALLGITRAGYEIFAPILTGISQFIDRNPAVVQAAAGIAAAFSGIIVSAAAVKLAFAGWGFITSAITLVRTALAGLGSGAMLSGLIGRIAALRTALFGLGGAATLGGWSTMFAAIATSARTAMTAVTGFFASLSVSSVASGAIAALRSIGTAILGAARAAFAFAFSPVGVALMALALAGMYCYQNWDKVAPVLSNIANIITGSLSGALATIAPAIQNVMSAFENLGNVLGASGILSQLGMLATGVLATIATTIAGILSTVINVAATIISTIANVLSGIVNLISNVLSGNWSATWENAKSIAIAAFEGIRDVVKGILDGIISTIENVGKAWSFITGKEVPTPVAAPSSAHGEIHGGSGGDFATSTTPTSAPIDTTTTQAALDAVGDSAQNAATNMDGVQQVTDVLSQIPASIQPTTDALAQFPASLEPVTTALADFPSSLEPVTSALDQMAEGMMEAVRTMSEALIQLGTKALNAATQLQTDTVALQMFGAATVTDTVALQMLGAASLATFVAIQMLGAAALGAYTGVANLGEAAGGAAIQVLGLGEAARSACAQLAAAGENAAAKVSAAVSSIKVGHNAEGGIYQRGAFLTTFAEKSPEAAIPLNHSKRAQNLWTQTGQLLGILPNDGRRPNWSIKRVPRIGGLKMPRINFPTMTPPTFPEERPIPHLSIPQVGGDLPPINVTIHVTINGNADEQVVRRGIEAALPATQRSFAEELAIHRREALRRSFA